MNLENRPPSTDDLEPTPGLYSSENSKKPYSSPVFTRYGEMSELTRLGAGDDPNDGDDEYGSPS